MTYERGSAQTKSTKLGKISNMTSAKLTLNSERLEGKFMHWHRLTEKLYLETLLLKRTFIQQIIEAIDTKYITAFRNPITGKITPPVPTILDFLHNNYRRITPHQLDDKTTTVKAMIYDLAQPIDIIFNTINDLVEYSRVAEA